MKIAIQILAIYMLALSFIPCGDGGNGIIEIANHFFEVEHQHISDHDQHSNGCGDDDCSPFCVCDCCSISINVPTTVNLADSYTILISRRFLSYNPDFYPSNFNASIWHPPTFS